ncbi:major facilitator superfamily domain-containing protein [Lipomyces starkeyi]
MNLPQANGTRDDSPDIGADGAADSVVGQEVDELSTLVAIFFSLYIGRFLCALDGTVIVTLLAHVLSEFHESRLVSWIASSYLIALAAFQPLFGKISDIYGRKQLLLFSNSVFAVSCILCGFSSNIWLLIFARIIAGIGGSGLNALSVITLSDLVPLRQRGLIHGIGNIIYNLGAVRRQLIGWRWLFFTQVPFVVISAIAIQLNLKSKTTEEIEVERLQRVDFVGSITLVSTLALLLLAVSIGGNYIPWSHPLIFVLFSLSFMSLAAFVQIETTVAKEPVLPLALLADRTILGSAVSNAFIYMIMYSQRFSGTNLVSNFVAITLGRYMHATGKYYHPMLFSAVLHLFGWLLVCTFGSETSNVLKSRLYTRITGSNAMNVIDRVLDAMEDIEFIPEEYKSLVKQSYLDACRSMFIFTAILGFLNIISCAVMKEYKLHTSIQRGR